MNDVSSTRVTGRSVTVACLFWLLCLVLTAGGHRLYKATVAADRVLSSGEYRSGGAPLVWVGYGDLDDATKRLAPNEGQVDSAPLTTLPASWFLIWAVVGFAVSGAMLAWSGRWIANTGIQSLVGVFSGHLLWLGSIEFGLALAARRLGLAGSLEVVEGRVVGTHGGGTLIQLSVVFLVPVLIGLTMHESNRCAVFQWFRRRLPIVCGTAASGRVENYAARTAIQYFMTVWFCYVSVLWMADPGSGAFGQVALLLTLVVIMGATPYMIWRTASQPGYSNALRYSISGAVVAWTGIEIGAAMQFFDEPWLSDSRWSAAVLLALSILLSAFASRVLLNRRPALAGQRLGSALGVVALIVFGITGCGRADDKVNSHAADVERRLREFDVRIRKPLPTAYDGLLQALGSNDPEMRAQAAIAFGKLRDASDVVKKQLFVMGAHDDSRLSRFAALVALQRLDPDSHELHSNLRELYQEPEWRRVVDYVRSVSEQ